MKRLAWSLLVTATIVMAIPLWGLFINPIGTLRSQGVGYILFILAPYTVAVAMLFFASKGRSD